MLRITIEGVTCKTEEGLESDDSFHEARLGRFDHICLLHLKPIGAVPAHLEGNHL